MIRFLRWLLGPPHCPRCKLMLCEVRDVGCIKRGCCWQEDQEQREQT